MQGIKIDEADREEITRQFSTIGPHPEVPAALRKLRNAGFRLFTLTPIGPKFKAVSLNLVALSIFANNASARTA